MRRGEGGFWGGCCTCAGPVACPTALMLHGDCSAVLSA